MTARSTSKSRASCCCPCGLAPVVTVAAGTRWGNATQCYASHHMMLVLLYGLAHNTFPTLEPRLLVFSTLKPRLAEHPNRQTVSFFFLHVAIRNSLRSNKKKVYRSQNSKNLQFPASAYQEMGGCSGRRPGVPGHHGQKQRYANHCDDDSG